MFGFGDDKALAGPTQVVRVNKKRKPRQCAGATQCQETSSVAGRVIVLSTLVSDAAVMRHRFAILVGAAVHFVAFPFLLPSQQEPDAWSFLAQDFASFPVQQATAPLPEQLDIVILSSFCSELCRMQARVSF
jgi:hypothetical protein